MWKHRIAYIGLWIASFLLYVFYVGYVSWLLFILVCSLPIFSLLYVLLGKVRLQIDMELNQQRYQRYDEGIIHIKTRTYTSIPLAKVQGTLHVYNTFTKTKEDILIAFGSAHKVQFYEEEYLFSECGKYTFELGHMHIHDPLNLFSFRYKATCHAQAYSLPKPIISEFPLPKVQEAAETIYDPVKKGNDRSETFGVHAYQPGDTIHAIHWKLSAKMDELMVREFSSPIQPITSLSFDLYGSSGDAQTILAHVYGSSIYLLSCGKPHEITQYVSGFVVLKKQIQKKQDIEQCLCAIFDQEISYSETSTLPSNSSKHTFYVKKEGVQLQPEGESHE